MDDHVKRKTDISCRCTVFLKMLQVYRPVFGHAVFLIDAALISLFQVLLQAFKRSRESHLPSQKKGKEEKGVSHEHK